MIRFLSVLFVLRSFHPELCAQPETPPPGIYIIATPPKKMPCPNEVRMTIGNHKICLSKKPIISADHLTYATDVQYDPVYQMHYIDIGLSKAGSITLYQTVESLPDTSFGLVLEGQVICVFKIAASFNVQSFRIGFDIPLKDLNAIHEVLEQVEF